MSIRTAALLAVSALSSAVVPAQAGTHAEPALHRAAPKPIPPAVCDSAAFQTVLNVAPATLDARAIWLDRRLVKWPGAVKGTRFRLYHSPSAAIVATPATRVTGAAGSIELDVFVGALPAAAAARFKYLGDGPVLAVKDADLARMPSLHREQLVLVQETADGTVHSATRLQVAGALDDIYAAERAAAPATTARAAPTASRRAPRWCSSRTDGRNATAHADRVKRRGEKSACAGVRPRPRPLPRPGRRARSRPT
jgi:hypothetical protein